MQVGSMIQFGNVIPATDERMCCMCGRKAKYIEINYEAAFCSEECIKALDKAYFEAERQEGIFENEDF